MPSIGIPVIRTAEVRAAARLWGLSFSGFIARVIGVGLHIYRLVGFRNRLVVMLNWAWDYIFYENQVRLITRD